MKPHRSAMLRVLDTACGYSAKSRWGREVEVMVGQKMGQGTVDCGVESCGDQGSMYRVFAPKSASHPLKTFALDSGPSSERTCSGGPLTTITSADVLNTSR